jgi:hypothetical protein
MALEEALGGLHHLTRDLITEVWCHQHLPDKAEIVLGSLLGMIQGSNSTQLEHTNTFQQIASFNFRGIIISAGDVECATSPIQFSFLHVVGYM